VSYPCHGEWGGRQWTKVVGGLLGVPGLMQPMKQEVSTIKIFLMETWKEQGNT
jgi:hypothetical protein